MQPGDLRAHADLVMRNFEIRMVLLKADDFKGEG